jgi:hydroxymethylpyrimidine kinase/phosphomethylpyrimidine kinase
MDDRLQTAPIVLAIAGFDPSGGAGVIVDVRTIEALGCTAVAAITSITFQNATAYVGAIHQSAASLRAQVESILAQHKIAAVKIGMLPTAEIVREVAQLVEQFNLPLPVIDPVMESTSGGKLMADDAFEVFVTELMPRARVVTPNIPEAEKLAGLNICDEKSMGQAAARIRELGARAVLIKGGHLSMQSSEIRGQRSERDSSPNVRDGAGQSIDILDDKGQVTDFRSEWIDAPNVRGTGCLLSSAIAACLARQMTLSESVSSAKDFVHARINSADEKKVRK